MKQYTVTITDEEQKALLTDMASIREWLDNAIHNKARQCIDQIVAQHTDRQPGKLTLKAKLKIIQRLTLKTAADIQAELEQEE